MDQLPQPHRFPWRLFWLLFALGILSALAVIPMAIELFGSDIATAEPPPIPLPLLIVVGLVQNLGMLAVMVFAGLKLGQKLGLGAPLLQGWLAGKSLTDHWRTSFKEGLISGLGSGAILLIGLVALVPLLPNVPFVTAAKIAVWKRVLACFYGGLYEEILARLFMVTPITWIANKALRKPDERLLQRLSGLQMCL